MPSIHQRKLDNLFKQAIIDMAGSSAQTVALLRQFVTAVESLAETAKAMVCFCSSCRSQWC